MTDPLAVLGIVSAEDIVLRVCCQLGIATWRLEDREKFVVHPRSVSCYIHRRTGNETAVDACWHLRLVTLRGRAVSGGRVSCSHAPMGSRSTSTDLLDDVDDQRTAPRLASGIVERWALR